MDQAQTFSREHQEFCRRRREMLGALKAWIEASPRTVEIEMEIDGTITLVHGVIALLDRRAPWPGARSRSETAG